ncbi:MAG: hypothetical protein K2X27_04530 [Candidatus Obscuribacterales bacterium]|nr:hypothetical protein [Candidatus Obscuribacterales bacterium]
MSYLNIELLTMHAESGNSRLFKLALQDFAEAIQLKVLNEIVMQNHRNRQKPGRRPVLQLLHMPHPTEPESRIVVLHSFAKHKELFLYEIVSQAA